MTMMEKTCGSCGKDFPVLVHTPLKNEFDPLGPFDNLYLLSSWYLSCW